MSALVTSVLTMPSFGSSLDCSGSLRLGRGKRLEPLVRAFRHLPLSSSDPPGLLTLTQLFLGPKNDRIALPLGKCHAGSLPLFPRSSPALPSACQARSGRPRIRRTSRFLQSLQSLASLTPKNTMTHQSKSGTVQFALDITADARLRFESLHQSMGLRTKAQTFEAILYFVSTKDKIDPAALQRMEKKIDHSIHLLESLT